MTKTELIKEAATKLNATEKSVSEVTNCLLEVIAQTLEKGEAVRLLGFGTFEREERAARKRREASLPAHGFYRCRSCCNSSDNTLCQGVRYGQHKHGTVSFLRELCLGNLSPVILYRNRYGHRRLGIRRRS